MTPVLVTEKMSGLASVSLGDTKTFPIKTFTLQALNSSTTTVSYNLSATLQRYGSARTPISLAGGTVTFPSGATVTVPPGQQVEIPVIVDPTGNTAYENIFLDGFVSLTATDTHYPDLHVPYTLFWGNWQDTRNSDPNWVHNPVIDQPRDDPAQWWWWGNTWLYWQRGSSYYWLGVPFNGTLNDINRNLVAISPNGDGYKDNLHPLVSLMRGTPQLTISVLRPDGSTLANIADDRLVRKSDSSSTFWSNWDHDWLWQPYPGSVLDGSYTVRLQAEAPGTLHLASNVFETVDLPLIIDTVNPTVKIESITQEAGIITLQWSGSDDRSGVYNYGVYADGTLVSLFGPETTSCTLPSFPATLSVGALDNAGNFAADNVGIVDFDLVKGWNLVTPGVVSPQSPQQIFGANFLHCFHWNAAQGAYEQPTALAAGAGYWIQMVGASKVQLIGDAVSTPFSLSLVKGWQQIGNPTSQVLTWVNVTFTYEGTIKNAIAAQAAGWIGSTYSWNGVSYAFVNYADGALMPTQGIYLKALVPCTITFNP